jgi:hypothetical protein
VKEKQELTWIDLRESFKTYVAQRIAIGKLANSTAARYELALREFDALFWDKKIQYCGILVSRRLRNSKFGALNKSKRKSTHVVAQG